MGNLQRTVLLPHGRHPGIDGELDPHHGDRENHPCAEQHERDEPVRAVGGVVFARAMRWGIAPLLRLNETLSIVEKEACRATFARFQQNKQNLRHYYIH